MKKALTLMACSVLLLGCAPDRNTDQEKDRPISLGGVDLRAQSVNETLELLRKEPGLSITEGDQTKGWVIVSEQNGALWSFAPPTHPAYPAVFRRQLVEKNGALLLDSDGKCEATKEACDHLAAEFDQLNANIAAAAQQKPN